MKNNINRILYLFVRLLQIEKKEFVAFEGNNELLYKSIEAEVDDKKYEIHIKRQD